MLTLWLTVYKCSVDDGAVVCLVRIFGAGTSRFLCRRQERAVLEAAQAVGLFPRIWAFLPNAIVYGYVEGVALKHYQLPCHAKQIAHCLAQWHCSMSRVMLVTGSQLEACIYPMLAKFRAAAVVGSYACAPAEAEVDTFIEGMQAKTAGFPIVFCHNDLLAANIILLAGGEKVWLIDFEYAGPNYRAFDFANLFCEYAGPGLENWRFPGVTDQQAWLCHYFAFKGGSQVAEIDQTIEQIRTLLPLVHLTWAYWALAQAASSSISFDYLSYAASRFLEWRRLVSEAK